MTIEYATRYRRASRIPAEPGKPYFIEKGEGERVQLLHCRRPQGRPHPQQEKLLAPGDFGSVPKNCAHAYRMEHHHSQVVGVAAGLGGTFERFFENLGAPAEQLGLPHAPVTPEPHKFASVPQEYDVRFPARSPVADPMTATGPPVRDLIAAPHPDHAPLPPAPLSEPGVRELRGAPYSARATRLPVPSRVSRPRASWSPAPATGSAARLPAGGHLASLLALSHTRPSPAGAMIWHAPSDLTAARGYFAPEDAATPEALLLGAAPAAVPERAREASPLAQVRPGAPPFLLVHGDEDTMVACSHSESLAP